MKNLIKHHLLFMRILKLVDDLPFTYQRGFHFVHI